MKVQNLLFLKMLVSLFSAILKKFGGLISNVMSQIESKNPHPLSPLGLIDSLECLQNKLDLVDIWTIKNP